MPLCEFFCHGCKRAFSKVLRQAKYEEGSIACPHCGSPKVEQQVSSNAVNFKSSQSRNDASRETVNSSASEEDDRARVLSDWEGEGGASGAEKEA
jgi:putative FmdB family regulatory protein